MNFMFIVFTGNKYCQTCESELDCLPISRTSVTFHHAVTGKLIVQSSTGTGVHCSLTVVTAYLLPMALASGSLR